MDKPRIRILIADDHLIIREGLRLILETEPEFELVGEASTGKQAIVQAQELSPDIVLMDLRMPELDGLSAIRQLGPLAPQVAVIILTTYNEDQLIRECLEAGARGFLLKDCDRETLFNTIRAAARGETLIKPEFMSRALAKRPTETADCPLSAREREVLKAAATGQRSKEIASTLNITERTVKAHLSAAYDKLGVDSRSAAIAKAIQADWI